ncbi:hypothetical protein C474_09754 [Halogeometricum pallidum JCM 14848]|uniref:Uncharacterized protein n=1 Tax=Halogeometricum pallidum JCM 14848 TaxID=1227487 RepID=M0D6L9_HALPD|nr:hypothetical protein [Halogeometricum pallidum]ELZ31110.1 hypothetical protein C474_09754 [Halogeometricum pallidum JCM 14848]
MSGKRTESCGRCAMSTVVDAVGGGAETDGDDADERRASTFGDDRIELSDRELRATSPAAWLSSAVSRLDDAASRFVYGSR